MAFGEIRCVIQPLEPLQLPGYLNYLPLLTSLGAEVSHVYRKYSGTNLQATHNAYVFVKLMCYVYITYVHISIF